MSDFNLLSINQWTTVKQWSLREAIEGYARHGVYGISVLRDKLLEIGAREAVQILGDNNMIVTGYCVGGLLTDIDPSKFQKSLDQNFKIIDEAAEIKAQCIVFLAGGLPEGSKDIASARARCLEGLATLLPYARSAGVTIALEPLHPMVCGFRSVLATLAQANDWYEQLGAGSELGIVVDVYHVWWDPALEREIKRAKGRITAFHVSDWLMDTKDVRLDRGMMGDGVIDIPKIRQLVEATGYKGYREVEIFSSRNWWQRDPDEVIEIVKERYLKYV